MKPVPIFLREEEKLSYEKPGSNEQPAVYVSDPRKPVPFSPDIPLTRNREYMIADQRFAARRPDAAPAVKPIEVSPELKSLMRRL